MAQCRRLDPRGPRDRRPCAPDPAGDSSADRRSGHAFDGTPLGTDLPAQGESVDSQAPSTSFETSEYPPDRAGTRMNARSTYGTSTITTHHLYGGRASS